MEIMIYFFDRLDKFMEHKGLNDNKITNETGISNGLIGKARKRGSLSQDNISKILHTYPDLNADWLMTGRGEMLTTMESTKCTDSIKQLISVPSSVGIPLIPIDAMAGFMTDNSTSIMEYECEHYFVPMFRGAEFLIPVKGSSMQPKYNSGDLVACAKIPLDTFFLWHKVYVIDTEQGVLIKRVERASDDEHILLVSDNPAYSPVELHKSHIHSLASVIGVIRLE